MFDVYGDAVMTVMSIAKRRRENFGIRNVLKWLLNMCNDGDDVTSTGSPFQTRETETGNVRSPTVKRREGWDNERVR